MKQDVFKNAPDNIKWFAIDRNEEGWWYMSKPIMYPSLGMWRESDNSWASLPVKAGIFELNGRDWQQTLIERI